MLVRQPSVGVYRSDVTLPSLKAGATAFALVVTLAAEYTALALVPHRWFTIHQYRGAPAMFGLLLLFFGREQFRKSAEKGTSFRRNIAALHLAVFFLVLTLQQHLTHLYLENRALPEIVVLCWVFLLPVVTLSLVCSFFPLNRLIDTLRSLRFTWVYAAVCSLGVVLLRHFLQASWDTSSGLFEHAVQRACFNETRSLLGLFYSRVVSDPASHTLGTDRFRVIIAGACSGIEGLALMSVFLLGWLVYARKELRLERVGLLIPIALALMWVLNLLRLTALIAIGSASHPDIALNGFHSQAGWICFNAVALGFLVVAQRYSWMRVAPMEEAYGSAGTHPIASAKDSFNAATIYLSPFLAITAAALVSQATTSNFEWLYPLRFFAALIPIWCFRHLYKSDDWRCGPLGPAVGVGVAIAWLATHFVVNGIDGTQNRLVADHLATLPTGIRLVWIIFRVGAASITVPIAEELAFRGFLSRRLVSEDLESVSYSRLGIFSIAASSLAFGLMHGQMWLMGTLTGAVFAYVARRRGRLGEALGAHVTANCLISIVVLFTGNYSLWS